MVMCIGTHVIRNGAAQLILRSVETVTDVSEGSRSY